MLSLAALALLFVTAETASARPWWGVSAGYGWGGPYYGVSYGTRVGHNGFVSVGVGGGGYGYYPAYSYGYSPVYYTTPTYDYTYSTPVYDSTYVTPATYVEPTYYTTPTYYYSTPSYYYGPSIGFSYYGGGWGRGWGGWRWR
jgi:hypothetical protein